MATSSAFFYAQWASKSLQTHLFEGRCGKRRVVYGRRNTRRRRVLSGHIVMRRTLLISSLYMLSLTLLALPYGLAL